MQFRMLIKLLLCVLFWFIQDVNEKCKYVWSAHLEQHSRHLSLCCCTHQWGRRNTNDLMFNSHVYPLETELLWQKKNAVTVHLYADRATSHRAPEEFVPVPRLVGPASLLHLTGVAFLALASSLTPCWSVHIWCFATNTHTELISNSHSPRSPEHPPPHTASLFLFTRTAGQTPI